MREHGAPFQSYCAENKTFVFHPNGRAQIKDILKDGVKSMFRLYKGNNMRRENCVRRKFIL
jgi:hypothetical protein